MANYQVLFNGETLETADTERVRDNLARELGLDERKAKQLFSGRTVVIRSQLDRLSQCNTPFLGLRSGTFDAVAVRIGVGRGAFSASSERC